MNTEIEIWKDVPNYENYQVSNLGRVKSLSYRRSCEEKTLKYSISKCGYKGVVLCKFGKTKSFKIHKLVAMAFLNHKPCGYELVVNHKDFNKLNNRLDNLEIVTTRENTNKKHLKSSSKYTGVSYNKKTKTWKCEFHYKGKTKYLGSFKNEYDAHLKYVEFIQNNVVCR
jgi:hypothetical protein